MTTPIAPEVPMAKTSLSLQPSEAVVTAAAAQIYAAYIAAGRVTEGQQKLFMQQAVTEALQIALIADESIQSDSELT